MMQVGIIKPESESSAESGAAHSLTVSGNHPAAHAAAFTGHWHGSLQNKAPFFGAK